MPTLHSRFLVVSGYVGPDHYTSNDGAPLLEYKVFNTKEEVLKYHKEFLACIGKDDTRVTFIVWEGVERLLNPIKRVTEYELK